MDLKRSEIAPGVGLAVMNTEKFKTDCFIMNFYIPLESVCASEVSLLSRVMSRGTALHPTLGSLNKYTDMLYGLSYSFGVSSFGIYQILTFRMEFLDGRFIPECENIDILSEALGFIREFFTAPLVSDGAFSADYTESEKKLLIDRIRGDIDNKDSYAFKRGKSVLLGSHPAAISPNGEEDTVRAVSAEALYRRYADIMENAHVESIYIGAVADGHAERIADTLRDVFAPTRKFTSVPRVKGLTAEDCAFCEKTEDTVAKQGRMILGYLLPYSSSETASVEIFVDIFGKSPVSRLFKNVRERLGLCYYCSASVDASLGVMYIRSGISEENLSVAREEIARQLEDIVAGNVSEEELEISKRSVISTCKTVTDSAYALGIYYLRRLMLGSYTDIEEYAEAVAGVEIHDVARIAARAVLKTGYYLRGNGGECENSAEDGADEAE